MKVEHLLPCHQVNEEGKIILATFSFQVYAMYC